MLKKADTSAPLPTVNLHLITRGENIKLAVTYIGRAQSEFNAKVDALAKNEIKLSELVQYIVKDWDLDYALTEDDLESLEDKNPGMIQAVIEGWRKAIGVQLVKN